MRPSHDLGNPLVQVCDRLLTNALVSPCRRIVKLPPDVVGGVANAVGLLPPQLDMDRVAEDRDAVLLRFQEADEVGWRAEGAPAAILQPEDFMLVTPMCTLRPAYYRQRRQWLHSLVCRAMRVAAAALLQCS